MSDEPLIELHCDACTWCGLCGPLEIEKHLRAAGHLRRANRPTAELVQKLLVGVAPQLTCPDCKTAGLRIAPHADTDDWSTAKRCTVCRQPLSPERPEANPLATRCLTCQQVEESGQESREIEYCARCGALLELRVSSRGGLTRYRLFCTGQPPCR